MRNLIALMPDRKGRPVRLSQVRGKKVLLGTWASWRGCRLDLPGWWPTASASVHVLSDAAFTEPVKPRSENEMDADASFALAVWFHNQKTKRPSGGCRSGRFSAQVARPGRSRGY